MQSGVVSDPPENKTTGMNKGRHPSVEVLLVGNDNAFVFEAEAENSNQ